MIVTHMHKRIMQLALPNAEVNSVVIKSFISPGQRNFVPFKPDAKIAGVVPPLASHRDAVQAVTDNYIVSRSIAVYSSERALYRSRLLPQSKSENYEDY